jgi:hypothetical protein
MIEQANKDPSMALSTLNMIKLQADLASKRSLNTKSKDQTKSKPKEQQEWQNIASSITSYLALSTPIPAPNQQTSPRTTQHSPKGTT